MTEKFVLTAEGRRQDYACDPHPLGRGGYAEVFAATHKPSGARVALKRLRKGIAYEQWRRRMKREIAAMRALAAEPNVMPVLDVDPEYRWYVMPLAVSDAHAWQRQLGDRNLAVLLDAVCKALTVAHAASYIHRDITPHNILYLEDPDGGRWVLADWGLVRVPPGDSSAITSTGAVIGTEGFIAPEVLRGGEASEVSDVFSLGRVAAWAITGRVPLAGEDVVPSGPYRRLIRAATRPAPAERCSLAGFRSMLTEISFTPPPQPTEQARSLLKAAHRGEDGAAAALLELAEENEEDSELYLDFVASLRRKQMSGYVGAEPEVAGRIAAAMSLHVREDFHGNFDDMNVPLRFIWDIAALADEDGDFGLLEDAAIALFEAEAYCARYEQRHRTRHWLEGLRGQAAAAVARALAAVPAGAEWYLEEDWSPSRSSDPQIRGAFHAAAKAAAD